MKIEDHKSIGSDSQKDARAASGRKPAHESRATEIRQRLIAWKQMPEASRPSLRALAGELGTSHQLLSFYRQGLDKWLAREQVQRIRGRAEAEGRPMPFREHLHAMLISKTAEWIEELRKTARRGPLNHWQIKMLKLHARHSPEAQELLQKYSHRALKRKRFAEIVKDTPRREGETYIAWARRILDECVKYGTKCPEVITEELLQKL